MSIYRSVQVADDYYLMQMAFPPTAQPAVLPPALPFAIDKLPVSIIHYDGDCYVASSNRLYLLREPQLGRACSTLLIPQTQPHSEGHDAPLKFSHNGLPVAILDDDPIAVALFVDMLTVPTYVCIFLCSYFKSMTKSE